MHTKGREGGLQSGRELAPQGAPAHRQCHNLASLVFCFFLPQREDFLSSLTKTSRLPVPASPCHGEAIPAVPQYGRGARCCRGLPTPQHFNPLHLLTARGERGKQQGERGRRDHGRAEGKEKACQNETGKEKGGARCWQGPPKDGSSLTVRVGS